MDPQPVTRMSVISPPNGDEKDIGSNASIVCCQTSGCERISCLGVRGHGVRSATMTLVPAA